MAFPTTTYTSNATAAAALSNNAQAAGLNLSGLQPIAQLQSAVANLLVSDPSTVNIPAGDVAAGTFGANLTPAATGAYTFPGAALSAGATGGVGYSTGAGGSVTQATDRSTGVTINKVCGLITTDSTSLAAGAIATFTVTNSAVNLGDTVSISQRSGSTANTSIPFVTAVAAGSFNISLRNFNSVTADTAAMLINFAVVRAVSA